MSTPNESIYNSLTNVDDIRLLHLEPISSLDRNSMKCTLQHVRLSDKPRYEALSYMWGPIEMRPLEINGKRYDVRENLWQALFHLQKADATRVLWIDAVCINQDDIDERNYQVSQMGMIYHKAWRVLSWLGPENPSTELGIWALNNHVEFLSQPITESWINQLNAVKMLCYCKYWTRLWIIQEVLSAKKAMWYKKMKTKRMLLVFCGRKSFDLANLYPLARATLSHAVVSDLHVLSQAKVTLKEI
jgi:hypothetical protein